MDASSTLAISTKIKINCIDIKKKGYFKKFNKEDKKPRANEQIRSEKVRLIDQDGNNLGIFDTTEALRKAKEAGLDLVEISQSVDPPVAKIIDLGKYLYQQEKLKKEKRAKQKQKSSELKTIKIGLMISEHDAIIKIKKLQEFLEEGNKVKIEMFLKGRQRANKDFAKEKFEDFLQKIEIPHKQEQPIKNLPTGFSVVISKA